MSLKFDINVEELIKEFGAFKLEAEREIVQGVSALAAATHAHVLELASQKLKSGLKLYQDNLGFEEISPGIWVVSVDSAALSLEDGGPAFDMKPGLLKNAHIGPDGKRSKVIPFDHNTPPSQRNTNANRIVGELKSALKDINKGRAAEGLGKISTHKIEKNADGSPRIGKLHEFDLKSEKPTDKAQHPALKGLKIYQSLNSAGKVQRDVMTFRTVSDSSPADSWIYPEKQGVKLLDEALDFIDRTWTNEILPNLFRNLR